MSQYTQTVVGIDVSKARLDVYFHPQGISRQFDNDKKGWKALHAWIVGEAPKVVVYEATGPYHRGMEKHLVGKGLAVARLDPRRVRRFAEALGIAAKTDPVDAKVLALFGAMLEPTTITLPGSVLEQLKELVAARRGLVQQCTRIANKSETASSRLLNKHLRQADVLVRRQIEEIDAECRNLVRTDPNLTRRLDILLSIPGIGDVTAVTLLADMPELGTLDNKQVASLMGVASIARDSGTFKGKRHIRGGRAQVRKAVYMAALVASRYNPDIKRKYADLIAKAKPPKVAITALIRKMTILANALLRDNRLWTKNAPCG